MIYLVQENAIDVLKLQDILPEGKRSLAHILDMTPEQKSVSIAFTDENFFKLTGALEYSEIDYQVVTNLPSIVNRYSSPLSEARAERLISYSEYEKLTNDSPESLKKFSDVLDSLEEKETDYAYNRRT